MHWVILPLKTLRFDHTPISAIVHATGFTASLLARQAIKHVDTLVDSRADRSLTSQDQSKPMIMPPAAGSRPFYLNSRKWH